MKALHISDTKDTMNRSSKKGKGGRSTATAKRGTRSHGSLPQIGSIQDTGATPIASDDVGGVETKAKNK